jgi:hypothetical protein
VDGVEARHPAHDEGTMRRAEQLAGDFGLLLTGGSDWHGDASPPADRAVLGVVTIPDAWLKAVEARHAERTAIREAT